MSNFVKMLRDMPLPRGQCSDGCNHLQKKFYQDGKHYYRCVFWDTFPMTLFGNPLQEAINLSPKRVEGPHMKDPTRECPHFAPGGEAFPINIGAEG